jgi:hypothetical protein
MISAYATHDVESTIATERVETAPPRASVAEAFNCHGTITAAWTAIITRISPYVAISQAAASD